MRNDLTNAMFMATFKIEQKQPKGGKSVGTGWLVDMSQIMGSQKIALVTAFHVFDSMRSGAVEIHWRRMDESGKWVLEPEKVEIRAADMPLWQQHPKYDIATMWVSPPKGPLEGAIPFEYLADEKSLKHYEISPGDELLALGFPRGLSANNIGFPILRSGRVASYPLWPVGDFPSFLMDFSVFSGNSGGPVYMSDRIRKRAAASETHEAHIVMGMLAQQVILTDERLEIGIVLHAEFIRETLMNLAVKTKPLV
jgi:hypothetical protein